MPFGSTSWTPKVPFMPEIPRKLMKIFEPQILRKGYYFSLNAYIYSSQADTMNFILHFIESRAI
jgi:hypothetical protein